MGMDKMEQVPGGGAYHTRETYDAEAERRWRERQPVFRSVVHVDGATGTRNTSIAPGAEIQASDRRYTVAKDGSLRRCLPTGELQPRPHSRNRRR